MTGWEEKEQLVIKKYKLLENTEKKNFIKSGEKKQLYKQTTKKTPSPFKYIKSYCKARSLIFLLVPEERRRNTGCQKDCGIIEET